MRLRGRAAARERGLDGTVGLTTAVLTASQAIDAAVVPKRFASRARELRDVLGVGTSGEATPKGGQVGGASAREHEPRIALAHFTKGIHEHAQANQLAAA